MKITFSFLLVIFIAGCFGRKPIKSNHEGESIPQFSLFLADSSTYFKTASLKGGKPVVFFYFGPGCPYCRAQMDDFIDNADKLKDIQIVLLTTSPFEEMKWFYEHYKLGMYHNMVVGVDYTNFFRGYFGTNGVPYLAVYGQDKKLREVFDGKVSVRQLRSVALH